MLKGGGIMTLKKKLILKNKNPGSIIYTVKAGDNVIWEGKDLHKEFKDIKTSNKGKQLTIGWRNMKEYLSV